MSNRYEVRKVISVSLPIQKSAILDINMVLHFPAIMLRVYTTIYVREAASGKSLSQL